MEINNFRIADFDIQIIFRETDVNGMHLLSSFEPFRIKEVSENVFFRLTVDDTLRPVPKEKDNVSVLSIQEMVIPLLIGLMMVAISILSRTLMALIVVCYRVIKTSLTVVVHSMATRICAHLDLIMH